MLPQALLVVGGADDCHQDAQDDADTKSQDGHLQGSAQALEIETPAVPLNKSHVDAGGEG